MNPKVSVIVPVYNTEKYLEKCLQSLVEQTLQEIEIVVIDDGSTDRSPEIIQHYSTQYPDKFLCFRKENGGQGAARNVGLAHCTGEYIGFLDSDDYVRPEMFETLWQKAQDEKADYVSCGYTDVYFENGRTMVLREYVSSPPCRTPRDLFFGSLVSPFLHLYHRSVIVESGVRFPEGMIYEDTAFFINLIPYIHKVACIEKTLAFRVLRSNSTMATISAERVAQIFLVMDAVQNWYAEKGWNQLYGLEKEYICTRILLGSSMERISKVEDSKERALLCRKTFTYLERNFPEYKKNPDMQQGTKNIILKSVAPWNVRAYVTMHQIKGRLGKQYI